MRRLMRPGATPPFLTAAACSLFASAVSKHSKSPKQQTLERDSRSGFGQVLPSGTNFRENNTLRIRQTLADADAAHNPVGGLTLPEFLWTRKLSAKRVLQQQSLWNRVVATDDWRKLTTPSVAFCSTDFPLKEPQPKRLPSVSKPRWNPVYRTFVDGRLSFLNFSRRDKSSKDNDQQNDTHAKPKCDTANESLHSDVKSTPHEDISEELQSVDIVTSIAAINAENGDGLSTADAAACYKEQSEFSDIQLYAAGSGSYMLANEICSHLGISLGRVLSNTFADGEIQLKVLDEVRNRDVFIIYSSPSATPAASPSSANLHSSIIELLLLVSTFRRSFAGRITAVMPYCSYFRQCGVFKGDTSRSFPLPAADMALMLRVLGVDRVIFVDVHSQRVEAFFNDVMPVSNIQPTAMVVQYFKRKQLRNPVVVGCDNTAAERAKAFWIQLQKAGVSAGLATVAHDKPERALTSEFEGEGKSKDSRQAINSVKPDDEEVCFVGDVEGCDCILIDDIIDTAEDIVNTAEKLKKRGANQIYVYATHGLLSGNAIERINASPIEEVIVTNSVEIPQRINCEKLRVISIGKLLGEAVRRIHHNIGVSSLYQDSMFDNDILTTRHQ